MIFIGELLLVEEMKRYHFILPKGFSLFKNSSIIYQTHVQYVKCGYKTLKCDRILYVVSWGAFYVMCLVIQNLRLVS